MQTATKHQTEPAFDPRLREGFPLEKTRPGTQWQTYERLRLLWTARRFLAKVAAAGLAAAALAAFLLPKQYESTVQLMPPSSNSMSGLALLAGLGGKDMQGLGAIAGDLLGLKTTGALFVGVLKCRTVQDRIIEKYELKKVYGVRLESRARQKLEDRTEVSEDRKSGILRVTVTDRDPKRAAAMADSYVSELDTLIAQLTTSSARRERQFLEERLSGVSKDLASAEEDFSRFASQNATLDITEQAKAMVMATATLEGQLIAAQAELQGLRQIYTNNNVRVRAVEARIGELRKQIGRIGGKAKDSAAEPEAGAEFSYPTLRQLPLLGVPYAEKFRRLKVEEAVFETLTKEYELAKVQEAKEIPTVKILDPPEVPERSSFPPRLWIIGLGTLSSLLFGAAWVVGTARWQEIDSAHPGKQLAAEIFQAVQFESLHSHSGSRSIAGENDRRGPDRS
ncbi:MAG TPA: Wzz/FepE/Etk N-terminal domain-containing protein [Candidatus Sulfotelmatobacter sp.]|nr:Wzz/FepE/Etk N-terminal domain-containing protein [Candidatus Sulfotelmatobacter sp.]